MARRHPPTPPTILTSCALAFALVLAIGFTAAPVVATAGMPSPAVTESVHHSAFDANATNSSNGTTDSLANKTTIGNVSYHGDGVVETSNDTTYLWQSAATRIHVDYRIRSDSKSVTVGQSACLSFENASGSRIEYECVAGDPSNQTQSVNFTLTQWPSDGKAAFTHPRVVVKREDISETSTLAQQNLSAVAITKGGDLDNDGLTNAQEIKYGSSITKLDTDGDGLLDGPEVHNYNTDPTKADTDGDGLSDPRELNLGTNPRVADTDGDGLSDGKEVSIGTNPKKVDTDGDGLSDSFEYANGLDPTSSLDVVGIGVVVLALPLVLAGFLVSRGVAETPTWVRGVLASLVAIAEPESNRDDAPTVSNEPRHGQSTRDEDYTTDSDRVVAIVEEAGGRIKQSEIVEETGWSKAKVSRLLSTMDDSGEITKVRLGRENLICVDEEAPDRRED